MPIKQPVQNYLWDKDNQIPVRMTGDDEGNVSITFDKNNDLPRIKSAIEAIRSCIGIASDLRVTILSGAVTSVSTLTNITNIGSNPANLIVPNIGNIAYLESNGFNVAVS